MKIFPDHWVHPDVDAEIIRTPTESRCFECDVQFTRADRGIVLPFVGKPGDPPELAFHRTCYLRSLGIGCEKCSAATIAGEMLPKTGLITDVVNLDELARQCDRCRFKELSPIGRGRPREVGGAPCWLCDRCYLEVTVKGNA